MMLCTIASFFAGMCIYTGGLEDDLKMTLNEMQGDTQKMTEGISTTIAFHNDILE